MMSSEWLVERFADGVVVFDPQSGDTHWLNGLAHEDAPIAIGCAPLDDDVVIARPVI